MVEEDTLCVGICLPDEDESYCIGCGRPWGTASVPSPLPDAVPPAPTFPKNFSRPDAEKSPDQGSKNRK